MHFMQTGIQNWSQTCLVSWLKQFKDKRRNMHSYFYKIYKAVHVYESLLYDKISIQ